MIVDKIIVDKMIVNKMTVDKMFLDEMFLDEMACCHWKAAPQFIKKLCGREGEV
jgi:hypothetical protein